MTTPLSGWSLSCFLAVTAAASQDVEAGAHHWECCFGSDADAIPSNTTFSSTDKHPAPSAW